jgi:hypothetical protein
MMAGRILVQLLLAFRRTKGRADLPPNHLDGFLAVTVVTMVAMWRWWRWVREELVELVELLQILRSLEVELGRGVDESMDGLGEGRNVK